MKKLRKKKKKQRVNVKNKFLILITLKRIFVQNGYTSQTRRIS